MSYQRVKTPKNQKSVEIIRIDDLYVQLSFVPYDYKKSTIVYFVSRTNGDEYGQFPTAGEAIERINEVASWKNPIFN